MRVESSSIVRGLKLGGIVVGLVGACAAEGVRDEASPQMQALLTSLRKKGHPTSYAEVRNRARPSAAALARRLQSASASFGKKLESTGLGALPAHSRPWKVWTERDWTVLEKGVGSLGPEYASLKRELDEGAGRVSLGVLPFAMLARSLSYKAWLAAHQQAWQVLGDALELQLKMFPAIDVSSENACVGRMQIAWTAFLTLQDVEGIGGLPAGRLRKRLDRLLAAAAATRCDEVALCEGYVVDVVESPARSLAKKVEALRYLRNVLSGLKVGGTGLQAAVRAMPETPLGRTLCRLVQADVRTRSTLELMRVGLAILEYKGRERAWPKDLESVERSLRWNAPLDPLTMQPFAFSVVDGHGVVSTRSSAVHAQKQVTWTLQGGRERR